MFDHSRLLYHSGVTLAEMGVGMALAVLGAFPLAWLLFRSRLVCAVAEPLFIVLQCVPLFVLAPLFVVLCGWSYWAIVLPTALMILFPLTMSIYRGINAVPESYVQFFRSHGALAREEFFKLRLPYAMPQLFAGLRISSAIAGVSAVAGEWAGGQVGLGVYLQLCRRNFDLPGIALTISCLALLSMSFYGAVLLAERFFMRWRRV